MIAFTVINMAGTIVLITVTPGDSTRVGLFIAFNLMQAFAAVNPAIFLRYPVIRQGPPRSLSHTLSHVGFLPLLGSVCVY